MNEFIEPEESTGLMNDNYFKNILEQTRKWSKFLAIMGFIGIGLMVLLAIGMMIGGGFLGTMGDEMGGAIPGMGIGFIYLILALLYYFPVKYLYDFSSYLDKSLDSGSDQMLKEAHGKLKSLFKFMGILTIIMLVFYALIIVVAIAAAL